MAHHHQPRHEGSQHYYTETQHRHPPAPSHHPQQHRPLMQYPLKGIPQPHGHDVLCGRGGQSNTHPGNTQWRMLVAANKELYISLPKKQKMLLSQSIVNAVRSQNPQGRFLQKDSANELWYDVGDKRAQEKTSQALREGAPEIRQKLKWQKKEESSTDDSTPTPSVSHAKLNMDTHASEDVPPDKMADPFSLPNAATQGRVSTQKPNVAPDIANPVMYASQEASSTEPIPYISKPPTHSQPKLASSPPQQHHQVVQFEKANDDNIPPPPTSMDPAGDFSFGSMGLMSDAEQARLMSGTSFGSSTKAHAKTDSTAPVEEHVSCHESVSRPAITTSKNTFRQNDNAKHQQQPHMPQPVDGGLEPVCFSFGSVMSLGTAGNVDGMKLEGAGHSFGSMMSYTVAGAPKNMNNSNHFRNNSGHHHHQRQGSYGASAMPVDGGFQDIGTSFGSLSLADGERERIIAAAEAEMRMEEAAAAATPYLQHKKSKGNLLDCSDTESEDDTEEASAQKSAEWDKLQATLAAQDDSIRHASFNVPPPLGGVQVKLDRDFSQMSAISVEEYTPPYHVVPTPSFADREEQESDMPPPAMKKDDSGRDVGR